MFTIDKIICSAGEPASKNVLWMDISTVPSTLKFFSVRGWEPISGGILKYKEATSTEDRVDILPNIPYIINGNNLPESFDITLLGDTSQEYFIEIVAPEAIDVTWPEIITWQNDTAPIIEGGKVYHISIVNTYGVYTEFTYTAPVPPVPPVPTTDYVEFSCDGVNLNIIRIDSTDSSVLPSLNLEVYTDLTEDWAPYSTEEEIEFEKYVRFRGTSNEAFGFSEDYYYYFDFGGVNEPVTVSGRLTSLLDYQTEPTSIPDYCFGSLFQQSNIVDASNLVFPNVVGPFCYQYMFFCSPDLVKAPLILPATTLDGYCYQSMFEECSSLTSAPALPATTLVAYCYQSMFLGCTSLTTAPALPATTLAEYCYESMFSGCTSLTSAPALPAIALAENCYQQMFGGCTSLTSSPALPAANLASACYNNMFSGCASLTTAPTLPSTYLTQSCYSGMFTGCTSLTSIPALPATTLAPYCYTSMFSGCTSLTSSPALPAATLATRCYETMFKGCSSLTEVGPVAITNWDNGQTRNWLQNVAPSGHITVTAEDIPLNTPDGVPSGWDIN